MHKALHLSLYQNTIYWERGKGELRTEELGTGYIIFFYQLTNITVALL